MNVTWESNIKPISYLITLCTLCLLVGRGRHQFLLYPVFVETLMVKQAGTYFSRKPMHIVSCSFLINIKLTLFLNYEFRYFIYVGTLHII